MSDEPRLTDEERLREAIYRLRDAARLGGMDFRQRDPEVLLLCAAIDELRARRAAPQAGPCGTCRHWKADENDNDFRACLNPAVDPLVLSTPMYTERRFGCLLWQPTERPSTGEEPPRG